MDVGVFQKKPTLLTKLEGEPYLTFGQLFAKSYSRGAIPSKVKDTLLPLTPLTAKRHIA